VITKPASSPPLGESIPPSTRKLLDVLGVSSRLDTATCVRSTGNMVWWGSATPRVEFFAGGERGWQVTTRVVEQVFRAAALDAGVTVEHARVDGAEFDTGCAPFILDCSGRAGVFARARKLRQGDAAAHRTIALVGVWAAPSFDTPEPSHTVIESYEGGWAWSVPKASESANGSAQRFVAVMIDPRTSDLDRAGASVEVYRTEIARAPRIAGLLRNARLVDGPRGWDASMYHASRYADDNLLLVGDAGSFIDPLSSAGVKKALASGWLAAVATHTSLVKPAMRATALAFFEHRERDVFASFRRMTDRHLAEAAAGHEHPFWSDRAVDVSGVEESAQAAFERIRTAPDLRLAIAPTTRTAERPAVSGNEIVMALHLVRDGGPEIARHAFNVDLILLVELVPQHSTLEELFAAYNRRARPVPLPDFLGALATAIAERWLRWCDT
jgi:2-polyprenyl-6-methoxyphenol hydroxylase-like FAD-dependent oxidoreductase